MSDEENNVTEITEVPEALERLSRALDFLHPEGFEIGLYQDEAFAWVGFFSTDDMSDFLSALDESGSESLKDSITHMINEGPSVDKWALIPVLQRIDDGSVELSLEIVFPMSDLEEVASIITDVSLEQGAEPATECDDPSHKPN